MGGSEIFIGQAIMAGLSAVQKSQAARAQNRQLFAQQALQQQQVAASRAIEERRRKEQLRQTKAAHRARFGGLGISANSGSAAAVLNGLSTRSSLEGRDQGRLSDLRLQSIGLDFANRRRRNLLEVRNDAINRGVGLLVQNFGRF